MATQQYSGNEVELTLADGDDEDLLSAAWNVKWRGKPRTRGNVHYEYVDDSRRVMERWDRDADGSVEEIVTSGYRHAS